MAIVAENALKYIHMENEKQSLIDELKGLLEQNIEEIKDQVEALKVQFYRSERTAEEEGTFKELLADYKARRAEIAKRLEAEQADNLKKKEAILAEMKTLSETETDDVMANLQRVRELQAEWKTIGAVPAPKAQDVWKQYNLYQEKFYDLVKINIELRDLDFKKNLELKTKLIEAAEALMQSESIVEANRVLQQLHEEWAEIGPVARELREDLWNRFKEASTVINKKHQAYFDELHKKEEENLAKKQALIERLKAVETAGIKSGKGWDEATERVQAIQTEWRQIGFAPKKMNQAIYDEYRALCDGFFKAKSAFYKEIRDTFSENLKQKQALIARVRELKDSQEWKETTDAIIAIQNEWKAIGPVAHKISDEVWKEFTSVCDEFFNAKREAGKAEREARQQEWEQKKAERKAREEARKADEAKQEAKIAKMKPNEMWEAIGNKWKVTKK